MRFEERIVTLQEVERYRAEARAMQSREIARLARRLVGVPSRLLRRVRSSAADRRDARASVTGTDAAVAGARHA